MIDRAIAIIQQDGVIDFVAECAAKMQLQESSILPVLEAELKEVNKGIENMLNAIQMGIVTDSTKARLESLEADKKRLDASIAKKENGSSRNSQRVFCLLAAKAEIRR